jgi:hypothetical protein
MDIKILKQNLPALKTRILHAETAFKSIGVTVASGGALTVHQYLTGAGSSVYSRTTLSYSQPPPSICYHRR